MSATRCTLNPNNHRDGRLAATQLQSARGPRMPCLAVSGTCTECCGIRGISRPTTTARVGLGCSRKPFYGSSTDGGASVLNAAVASRTSTKADARGNQIQHLQINGPNWCNRLLLAPGYVDVNGGARASALANATRCCTRS